MKILAADEHGLTRIRKQQIKKANRTAMNQFFVGVDLGQRRDFTAIAVVERGEDLSESAEEEPAVVVGWAA